MKIANLITLILSLACTASGFFSAYYWWKASMISVDPGWGRNSRRTEGELPMSCDPEIIQSEWIGALLSAAAESSELNKKAAQLTALAVGLGTASSMVGLLKFSLR